MFIMEHSCVFPVKKMCQTLNVSKSSYYYYRGQNGNRRREEDNVLLGNIMEVHKNSNGIYGYRRVREDINPTMRCSYNRVARLMKENHIRSKIKRKFRVTTWSHHKKAVAPDLLKKEFKAQDRDEIWASDITYIWTQEGWLYLTVILDIYSRRIVGWSLENTLKSDIVRKALLKALYDREPQRGLILHSDRGVQYASDRVRDIIKAYGIRQSMSATGDCYGNAITETFFHTLKTEHVFFQNYETREAAKLSMFEYIEMFYNRSRSHSSIGYMSPEKFEQLSSNGGMI